MVGRREHEPAPSAYLGADKAPPLTWRSARQNLLVPYLAPLVFFGFSILSVIANPALSGLGTLIGLLNIAALVLLFVGGNQAVDLPERWRVGYCLLFVAMIVSAWPLQGVEVLQNALFVSALCALLLRPVWANAIGLPWGVFVLVVGMAVAEQIIVFFGAMSIALVIAISLALRLARSEATLASARLELEQAMLAAERERIARDMHDILGQSLTAIAIKGDLIDRAMARNPTIAKRELDELRSIARTALTDLRATTNGLRKVDVNSEIASARAVLAAAGIEAHIELADQMPAVEAAGFVVREAATNAARHSAAAWCRIVVGPDSVTVTDNGRGLPSHRAGSGLAGLGQRVRDAGGELSIRAREGGGTVVQARFHAAGSETVDIRAVPVIVGES